MYKKHRIVFFLSMLIPFLVALLWEIDYAIIASEGITIVAIVLAIYMTSFSGMISSELAKKMKCTQDAELIGKSQLGVLRSYLNVAVLIGVLNIVVACISIVLNSKQFFDNAGLLYYLVSSIGYATLAGNLFLMLLLYRFMVNRQLFNK